jgi:hypothetical protein
MKSSQRLVPPSSIPLHLWEPQSTLINLPAILAISYEKVLSARNLVQFCARDAKEIAPIGGISHEATNDHFAKAFDGSLARCQLAVLDPLDRLGDVSNGFIRCLAGNEVVVLDAPCGAAAAVLSTLCTIAELRSSEILPRLPLNIKLVGGELSPFAIELAREMFDAVKPTLETQGIFVEGSFQAWDVTDKQSNVLLVQAMLRASDPATKRLVIISNFSGFLEKGRKRKLAIPQIEELLRHTSTHDGSIAVWIEPDTNETIGNGGLFQAIQSISSTWNRFLKMIGWSKDHSCNNCSARFRDPINDQQKPRVGVAVIHFELGQQP